MMMAIDEDAVLNLLVHYMDYVEEKASTNFEGSELLHELRS
jgi:hypothetical protein